MGAKKHMSVKNVFGTLQQRGELGNKVLNKNINAATLAAPITKKHFSKLKEESSSGKSSSLSSTVQIESQALNEHVEYY